MLCNNPRFVGWDRESDSVACTGEAENRGIDSDDFAGYVDKWSSTVASVDRRVGLYECCVTTDGAASRIGDHVRSVECAHMPDRYRIHQLEGATDRHGQLTRANVVAIAKSHRRKVLGVDLYDCKVTFLCPAYFTVKGTTIVESDFDLVESTYNVIIREYVAVGANDDAGTGASFALSATHHTLPLR